MPDWWNEAFAVPPAVSATVVFARCLSALVAGGAVAWIYAVSRAKSFASAAPFGTTLALLAALIALVTQVIGDNTARAFGLVGALSIVRFRSNVEDTRDTAFVIFAVVAGMAIGAGQALVAAVGIPTIGVAALTLGRWRGNGDAAAMPGELAVKCATGIDPNQATAAPFDKWLAEHRILGASLTGKAAVEATYLVTLRRRGDAVPFILDLQRVEGVLSAELKPV